MDDVISREDILKHKDKAFFDGEFVIYYQPKYNQSTGALVGAEALTRWFSKELGLVSPNRFIPVFEEDDTITKLDLYIFECVCRLLSMCEEKRYYMAPISVNLTRRDIFTDGFIDRLEEIASSYNVDRHYINLEITESSALGSVDSVNKVIRELHACGYHVAMDDFGKGYSSLNLLRNIDIDEIKIDMDFIRGTIGDRGGIILSSVIRMAKWLQLPVIVEGVETKEQPDFSRASAVIMCRASCFPNRSRRRNISGCCRLLP